MKTRFRFSQCSLRLQIALVFGGLSIAMALLLSLSLGELLRQRAQRDVGAALQLVAENANTLLADGLAARWREALVLADAHAIWSEGLDSVHALHMLERHKAMDPFNAWIGVADAAGMVRMATGNMLVGQSVAQRPWFQKGLAAPHVGDVHPAKLLDKLLPPTAYGEPNRFLDFAAPIRLHGQTIGVVGIHGSWEWTRQVLQGLTPPLAQNNPLELFIFDSEGRLILAPAGQETLRQAANQVLPEGLQPHAPTGGPGPRAAVVQWQDGRHYLTAATRLQARNAASDLGWSIVARQPVERAFAEANDTLRLAFGMGLAAALLTWLLAWRAARRLSLDLDALAAAASAVDVEAHLAVIPEMHSNREVRQLSQALTRMTERLLGAHDAMEATVRQRTHELQQANLALDRQARTDALTGLLNRRGFEAQMAFAWALARRSGRPLALVSVDVDHFKRVNDTHGHAAGDEVLRRLANTLQERVRGSDVVARIGGEEFVVLLPDTDLGGAQHIAEALVQAVAGQTDPVAGRVTVSAGVASLHGPQADSADLLRRADAALYAAKHQGRNRVCIAD